MRRRVFLIAAAACAAILARPAPAVAAPIPLEEHVRRLDRATALAISGAADPSPAAMEAVRAQAALPAEVVLGDRVVAIPADPILDSLGGRIPAEFDLAALRLQALAEAARAAVAVSPPDPDRIRAALREAYRGIQARPSWLQRLGRAAQELLRAVFGRVLDSLAGFRGAASLVSWAVVLGLIALAVVLLMRVRLVPEREVRAALVDAGEGVDWGRRAEEALARGDLEEAARALFRALVRTLAERGVVRDTPSLTAGECRSAVEAGLPELFPDVARASAVFERAAYGGLRPRPEELEAIRRAERAARAA